MLEEQKCPQCGAALPSEGWAGLCPNCLLRVSLENPQASEERGMQGSESSLAAQRHGAESPKRTILVREPDVLPERTGMMIGRYKLLQQIGEGGFGVVFMAEQQEPVQRKVALKIIKAGMDTREVIARFEAERQALALMDHPNIAQVLDAGATASGRPYFVMELVRGMPITDYCDHANLSTRERLELFTQVCRAVQHAHQKGVIHRDLKPTNLLVTLHDGEPVAKVIDFGVAKALGQKLTNKTLFTRFEQMIGTPAYMSPEQAALSGLDVDTRSDIYSLGVLLYELLTGVTPLDAETLRQAALDEVRRMIQETEPPKPSTRLLTMGERLADVARHRHTEPNSLTHLVRGDLDWITMKALEKDRRRRYETVNGLAADIERHLHDEPVVARPPSALYRMQKVARRHRVAFAAGAVVTVALVLGAAISTWLAVRATRAEREQRTLREEAVASRQKAEAAATETRMTLATSDFFQAVRLISEDHCSDAMAYLVRSLSANPTNDAALTRLATLLTYHSWMGLALALKHSGIVVSEQFSPDGKWIVTASGDTARVWDAQSGQPLTEPLKHPGPAYSAQFSPDGKRIVTVSEDHTARVWDAQSGQPLSQPLKHDSWVNSAQFSPDGKRIVTAWGDTARVWDAQSGEPLTEPLKHPGPAYSARFSPDGKRIVTASGDTARVWDAQSGQPLTEPLKHNGPVHSAQFSPDGKRIVTASGDTARLWDAQSGQPLTEPLKHNGGVVSVRFSPDGKRIVTGSSDYTARVWDTQSGQPLTNPLKHNGGVVSAQFSPDGKRIVTASSDYTARVWDAQSGQPLSEPFGPAYSAQFSSDGKRIVTSTFDTTARVWNALNGQPLTESLRHNGGVVSAQFSSDGKRIVTTSSDKTARVWDALNGQPLTEPLKHNAPVSSAHFSADGKRIVTASSDKTARVWDAFSGQPLIEPLKHSGPVLSAQFSPDGKRIVTASLDGSARVWDAQSGQLLTEPLKHNAPVSSAHFSADGKRIVTASGDTARVWDAQSGQPLTEPLKHNNAVVSAQFSPDGKRIVTGSSDYTARVWDTQSGQLLTNPLKPLKHNGGVVSARFSPDGKRIVTASHDHTARVWDAQSGQPLTEPLNHDDTVGSAQFSPDGKRIVTASYDQTARVWDAQSGQPLSDPLKHSGRVHSAQFSPDGKRIVTASDDKTARVWDVGPCSPGFPDWPLRLSEAISGQALNKQGILEQTKLPRPETLKQIREKLSRESSDDDWVVLGRWLLADPLTRTISPFSKIAVPEYIERRIKENTAESLVEAERLAFGNVELLERISQARKALELNE